MGTLSNELSAILEDIDDSYTALAAQGATLPAAENQGTDQLPGTIATIPHPQLYAPSISRNGDTISISSPTANGSFVSKYKLYNSDVYVKDVTNTNSFSLSELGAGTYNLSVKASGANFNDSPKSNVIKGTVYSVTRTLTNLTASNSTALIADGVAYTVTLTPESGYYLPEDIAITINGNPYTRFVYDSYTGSITIPTVNGNVVITAVADNVNRLRRPVMAISDGTLTINWPQYATGYYIRHKHWPTYDQDTSTLGQIPQDRVSTIDLDQIYGSTYGRHTIEATCSATGYTDSNTVSIIYDIGATISVTGNTLTIVDAISGVNSYDIYVDNVLVGNEPATTPTIDLSPYTSSVQDGKRYVTVDAIGSGIASNRSNAAVWFVGVSPIYGVSGLSPYVSSPALTRTDDAVGMSFEINSSSGAITSDFNDVFPWNVAEVVDDDAGKFVSFPEMYFRIVTTNGKLDSVAVSAQPSNEGNWYRVAPFMYGCYGASVADNKMRSVSGVERSNYSRANYRTRAFANGDGYLPIDLYHRNVLMLLWWIEFATKKSDSIMSGRISGSGTAGGATRRPCGGTDSVPTPSGFEPTYGQMRYHYIEDFVGNVMEMVDGIYLNAVGQYDYVTADPANFSETTDGKSPTPFVNPSNNEISAYGWDPDNPFLFMPCDTVSNGSYNTYFCDAVYHYAGYPVMLAGARYDSANALNGLSFVSCANATFNGAFFGSRLLKIS